MERGHGRFKDIEFHLCLCIYVLFDLCERSRLLFSFFENMDLNKLSYFSCLTPCMLANSALLLSFGAQWLSA